MPKLEHKQTRNNEIRHRRANGESVTDLARAYNLSTARIVSIIKNAPSRGLSTRAFGVCCRMYGRDFTVAQIAETPTWRWRDFAGCGFGTIEELRHWCRANGQEPLF